MQAWKGKSRGGSFGYRFFIFVITKLGIRYAYFFLVFVVVHFIPFAPLATKSNWHYFRKIQHYSFLKTLRMLYLNYYRFGQIMIDKVAVRSGMENMFRYEFENYKAFKNLLDGPTGVIMIGAHVGNWEAGGSFFGHYAHKMNIVMYDAEYQKIKDILEKKLINFDYKIIPIENTNFEHIYKIKDALDAKEYVCFQGDRTISENTSRTMNFMGRPADFPLGPFLLATKYKVPVVFYFSMREKGMKYRFKFITADNTVAQGERPEHALLRQYVNVLETIVRQYPEQWFNYYKFWHEQENPTHIG